MSEYNENLPRFYLEVDEDKEESGVDTISFVEDPATEVEWYTFNKESIQKFKKDEDKRVITAPVMLAETEIFRTHPTMGDYFVKFSEETIFKMMKKYFNDNKINRINENHESKSIVDNVIMIESFIVGDRVKSEVYPDLPNGSWVASFHVQDEDYWNDVILSDSFTGVSLEGSFDMVETKLSSHLDKGEKLFNELKEIANSGENPVLVEQKLREKLNIE